MAAASDLKQVHGPVDTLWSREEALSTIHLKGDLHVPLHSTYRTIYVKGVAYVEFRTAEGSFICALPSSKDFMEALQSGRVSESGDSEPEAY